MGLVENLQRRAAKLGLGSRVARSLPIFSLLAVILGIAWILVLPIDGQYRKTYISENALLPAQAQTYFRESEWSIVRGYREEVRALVNATDAERADAVAHWFEDIGLKTVKHEWQLKHNHHPEEAEGGTNVYSILHAPRGAHSEAMVLAAPWINMDGQFNEGGVALVVALARYLKRWSIWSKNIIFVVSSDSHFAMRTWIQAYHTTLENTAGAIEGAVVLDYPDQSDYVDGVEIFYSGLNGQLPNLDLINTAVIISEHEGLHVEIQGMWAGFAVYKERLQALGKGILSQLISGIFPSHGANTFSGWRVDAITIRQRGINGPMDITTFGRIAESTLRSISNLLEHFHQSFFFYFLLAPRKFVSIGTYLPAAMLTANNFSLMALYEVIQTWNNISFHSSVLLPSLVLFVVGVVSASTGVISLHLSTPALYPFAVSTGILFVSMRMLLAGIYRFNTLTLVSLHAMSMVYVALALTTLATVNFSLSLVLAVVMVPLAWVRPSQPSSIASIKFQQSKLVSRLLLLISSPWAGLYALSVFIGKDKVDLLSQLVWSWRGLQVWNWFIIIGVWLPVWIVGLIVGW